MEQDLEKGVMRILSVELSSSFDNLRERLGVDEDNLKAALKKLITGGFVLRSKDPVRDQDYYAPTGRGILMARRETKSAF